MFRRKRYATIVISLLTLVFVGVGTVVSLMTLTTFRPLPFANPEQLVTFLPLINGGADPWQADTLALTTRLVPQLTEVASYSAEPASTGVSAGAVTKQARVIATSPNFFDVLRMRLEQPNAAATYAATPGGAIITRQLVTALGLDARSSGKKRSSIRQTGDDRRRYRSHESLSDRRRRLVVRCETRSGLDGDWANELAG